MRAPPSLGAQLAERDALVEPRSGGKPQHALAESCLREDLLGTAGDLSPGRNEVSSTNRCRSRAPRDRSRRRRGPSAGDAGVDHRHLREARLGPRDLSLRECCQRAVAVNRTAVMSVRISPSADGRSDRDGLLGRRPTCPLAASATTNGLRAEPDRQPLEPSGVRQRRAPAVADAADDVVGVDGHVVEEDLVNSASPVIWRSPLTVTPSASIGTMNIVRPLCLGTSGRCAPIAARTRRTARWVVHTSAR